MFLILNVISVLEKSLQDLCIHVGLMSNRQPVLSLRGKREEKGDFGILPNIVHF